MEQKISLYKALEENEFIALITSPEFEETCRNDPELKFVMSYSLKEDFTFWPTNILFSQDMFK